MTQRPPAEIASCTEELLKARVCFDERAIRLRNGDADRRVAEHRGAA